jgi:alcohol dehydrogenase YqhD (iron-dependent ADH family)
VHDLTHGIALAVLIPHWFNYILNKATMCKLAQYARSVWNITEPDAFKAAQLGIMKTSEFLRTLNLPDSFSEAGIRGLKIEQIIQKTMHGQTIGKFQVLTSQDLYNILSSAK